MEGSTPACRRGEREDASEGGASMRGEGRMKRITAYTRMSDLEGKREFRSPDIRGWTIVNTTGHEVGKVEEVFVDPNTLEAAMALLHYRKFMNFNTKKLLVPWEELQIVRDGEVRTRPAEDVLASAPEWDDATTDWAPFAEYWKRRGEREDDDAARMEDEISIRA
jgi:sporulation protein YlmC with PRC-barrel domain